MSLRIQLRHLLPRVQALVVFVHVPETRRCGEVCTVGPGGAPTQEQVAAYRHQRGLTPRDTNIGQTAPPEAFKKRFDEIFSVKSMRPGMTKISGCEANVFEFSFVMIKETLTHYG